MKGKTMRSILIVLAMIFAVNSEAGVRFFNTAGSELGAYSEVKCGTGVTCSQVSGKLNIASTPYGPLQTQVPVTATTITLAQCGSTFIGANSSTAINLPEASAALGCRLTFITGSTGSNMDVNPDDADQILIQTNAAGDAIRNGVAGDTIVLEAISASKWAPVSVVGTFSDIN